MDNKNERNLQEYQDVIGKDFTMEDYSSVDHRYVNINQYKPKLKFSFVHFMDQLWRSKHKMKNLYRRKWYKNKLKLNRKYKFDEGDDEEKKDNS